MAVTIFEKPVGTEIATLESNVVFKRKSPYYGSLKTISNCLLVDTGNMNGANNDAGIVTNSSQYAPTDLVTGIREVFWISSSNIAIKINGISSTGWYKEWFRHYNGSTWTAWNEFALNSSLHNYIRSVDKSFYNVVVSADNDYKKLGNFYNDIGLPSGAYIVSYYVRGWSGATGAFTLMSSSNGEDLYIYAAKAGTITSITVRVWYSML